MATIYLPPSSLPWKETDYSNYDHEKEIKREDDYAEQLRQWCRKKNKGDTVGEIIRVGVADGYAQYMVYREKPLQLIHLPFGDKYSAGAIWERGIRLSDVRQMIAREKKLKELFQK